MPIRLCQKCGLKVLIDESQAGANPFYCQRCTTAMKSSGEPSEAVASGHTPSRREVPSAVAAPTPQPSGPSRATVKVLCPYCKASFNGRIPQKPARGACPVCQKELILLPTGDIRPAQGFDISKWQEERKGEPAEAVSAPPSAPETGTRLLVKKFAAEAKAASPPPAARRETRTRVLAPQDAAPPPPSEPPAEEGTLPEWLDDKVKTSEPGTDDLLREKEAQRDPAATEPEPEMPAEAAEEPAAEPVPPIEEPAPAQEVDLAPLPEREEPPPPPPAAPPGPGLRKQGTVRRLTERKPLPAPVASTSAPTGGGKIVVAWIMLILPLIACPVLLNSQPKLKGTPLVMKVGGMFQKGFLALHKKLFPPVEKKVEPPPPPPAPIEKKEEPPPPPPPPDPNQRNKDEQKISNIWGQVLALRRNLKQIGVAATDQQKADLEKIKAEIQKKEDQVKDLRAQYRTAWGKDYDPDNP